MEREINVVSSPQSPPNRQTRAELLIDHVAQYELTTRAIASRLFCGSSPSKTENLFGRLLNQRRIVAYSLSKQPPLSYYTLARTDAARLGASVPSGRLSGRRIYEALAILYFCHHPSGVGARAKPAARRRAPAKLIEQQLKFPLKTLSAPFVVQAEPEQFFARTIVPGWWARPDYALKIIQVETNYLARFPEARLWLSEATLRFLVLTHSEARKTQFTEALLRARAQQRLPDQVRVDVEHVDLPIALPRLRKEPQP